MNIFYQRSAYISHRKAAEAYMECLAALGHDLVEDAAGAEFAIFHDDASNFPLYAATLPLPPGTPRAGFCVWEADILPEAYIKGLAAVDRVWTPSDFSLAAIEPHFPGSRVLPHVVSRGRPGRAALSRIMERIGKKKGADQGPHFFYTVIDSVNPRKNLPGLLEAFVRAFPGRGEEKGPRLVVKQYRKAVDLSAIPGVIGIDDDLDDEHMAALHAVCDTFVSAHHAEGWGMALSEAMSFGNPVLATGYSGNMQFMNDENSVPLPYTMVTVPQAMCDASPLFTREMRWADVDIPAFAAAMRRAATNPPDAAKRRLIQESVRAFSPENTARRLEELLREFQ